MRAALCIDGRVVVGDSHLACFQGLDEEEQNSELISGFFDSESRQFIADKDREPFFEKELYLVRHGECQDGVDPDITESGADQVRHMANRLSDKNIKQFEGVTSPMLRCLRTAAIMNEILGIQFSIIPEVMETPNFLQEGQIFKLRNRANMFPQFKWPTSEEWHVFPEHASDFFMRVKDTLRQIPSKSIVVTHYGFICLTAKIALCKKVIDGGIPPASVTYLYRHDAECLG